MRRDWKLYLTKQKYSECQLVTALNIWTYLTGKSIKQDSKRYESLVDLAKARHGSAIEIEKVHRKLGIRPGQTALSLFEKLDLPFELMVWHKSYGFHSVAVVDYEPRTESFRIPNFDRATNTEGWIYREDLNHFGKLIASKKWLARSFKLVKD